jgi:hypothetical protein
VGVPPLPHVLGALVGLTFRSENKTKQNNHHDNGITTLR